MRTENWKKIVAGCGMVLLAAYVGGFFEILFLRSEVCLNPLQCLYAGCGTSSGRKWSMAAVVLLLALTVLVIWCGKDNPLHDERNFEISDQGTYGTAGFMGTQEQKEILPGSAGRWPASWRRGASHRPSGMQPGADRGCPRTGYSRLCRPGRSASD